MTGNAHYVLFSNRDTLIRIRTDQILVIAAEGNYTHLQTVSGQKFTFSFSLKKMEAFIEAQFGAAACCFLRVGKSIIINKEYVYQIDIVKNTLKLLEPLSRKVYSLRVSKEALRILKANIEKELIKQ
jgi:DNA-binding LytR/AlgR family response regulator